MCEPNGTHLTLLLIATSGTAQCLKVMVALCTCTMAPYLSLGYGMHALDHGSDDLTDVLCTFLRILWLYPYPSNPELVDLDAPSYDFMTNCYKNRSLPCCIPIPFPPLPLLGLFTVYVTYRYTLPVPTRLGLLISGSRTQTFIYAVTLPPFK